MSSLAGHADYSLHLCADTKRAAEDKGNGGIIMRHMASVNDSSLIG